MNYSFCCTSLENFIFPNKSHIPQIVQNSVIILFHKTLDASTQNVKNIQNV